DDSAVVRQLMCTLLGSEVGIHVTTASDPVVAMAKMRRHRPHVILLDLEMPRMDGLTFLKQIMSTDPLPVVVCSGFAEPGTMLAMRALAAGAVDVLPKPRVSPGGLAEDHGLLDVVRAAAQAKVGPARTLRPRTSTLPGIVAPVPKRVPARPPARTEVTGSFRLANDAIVAIGASTGGTEALRDILRALPYDAPGIVVVQHMPAGFTAAFAQHLNAQCKIEVLEAASGDRVIPGRALIARGDRHLVVRRRGFDLVVELTDDAPVCRHRPSVDVLFHSVADRLGSNAVGVILTGMGADGAKGLLAMRRAGAPTIAQDEATSVVFGMPKEAIDLGAADVVLPLPRIAAGILQRVPTPAGNRTADANR
ncbi:MAG TPA: chemotaxis response regulator protein-glutamate methylesterase, partial [Polyangia bacterium]|nr:chemotaxis response regulator protein-glutamate methylesterase [Polyangia bacterium]